MTGCACWPAAKTPKQKKEKEKGAIASYHLSVKNKQRGYAASHYLYICREGKYTLRDEETLVAADSGNMPAFAAKEPLAFWQAGDQYERKNGRACRSIEIALPNELSHREQIELTKTFIERVIGNRLPYSYAIHDKPAALEPSQKQPHAHIMLSERINDNIQRTAEAYFRRANAKYPKRGGAKKDRSWNDREKINELRQTWQDVQNEYLKQKGINARVDCRSHADIRKEALQKGEAARADLYDRPAIDRISISLLRMNNATALKDTETYLAYQQIQREKQLKQIKETIHHLRTEDGAITIGEARYQIAGQLKKISIETKYIAQRLSDMQRRKAALERASGQDAILSAAYNRMTQGKYKKERAKYAHLKKQYEKIKEQTSRSEPLPKQNKQIAEIKKAAAQAVQNIKDMENSLSAGKNRYKRDALCERIAKNIENQISKVNLAIDGLEKEAAKTESDRIVLTKIKAELWPKRGDQKINFAQMLKQRREQKQKGRLNVKLYEEELER